MSYKSRLTSKGQITIPKALREKFRMQEGDEVVMLPSEEGIVMKPAMNLLRSLRGLMRGEVKMQKVSRFIKELRREWRIE